MRLIDIFAAPLARVEGFLMDVYARVLWTRVVRRAERLRRSSRSGGRVIVITHPFSPRRLAYFDRDGFRDFKRRYRMRRDVNFGEMMAGAWYYTASREGGDGLSGADYEARRRAFLRAFAPMSRRPAQR